MDSNPFLIDTLMSIGVFIMFVLFVAICIFAAGAIWGNSDSEE